MLVISVAVWSISYILCFGSLGEDRTRPPPLIAIKGSKGSPVMAVLSLTRNGSRALVMSMANVSVVLYSKISDTFLLLFKFIIFLFFFSLGFFFFFFFFNLLFCLFTSPPLVSHFYVFRFRIYEKYVSMCVQGPPTKLVCCIPTNVLTGGAVVGAVLVIRGPVACVAESFFYIIC